MKERPILFDGPMVRAVLAGTKTQTRRLVKLRDLLRFQRGDAAHYRGVSIEPTLRRAIDDVGLSGVNTLCPYGQPGDRLWVRETTVKVEEHGYVGPVYVESDEGRAALQGGLAPDPDDCTEVEPHELRLRPSIFMPRSMARIVLEIVSVRVERLQDISEADAKAEGITPNEVRQMWLYGADAERCAAIYKRAAVRPFSDLWESINGPGSWATNPWVWVIEFKQSEAAA